VRRGLSAAVSLSLVLSAVFSPSANSVYKGEAVVGEVKVLTLGAFEGSRSQWCSMSMLTERIIVTAGHCLAADATSGGKLRFDVEQLWVTQPGADMASDDLSTRVKVSKVVLIPGYENYWEPAKGDRRTQRDDIAFMFLEAPLKVGYTIPIANAVEVSQLKNSGALITHFGYGLQEQNKVDQKPYKLSLRVLPNSDQYLDSNKTIFTQEDGRALCPGDSGGPWYADFNGVTKIVAVTVAAGGCRGNLDPRGWTLGTLIHPYLDFMKAEWEKFLVEEVSLKAAREQATAAKVKAEQDLKRSIETAKKDGTYIQDSSGCHSRGVQATLQLQSANGWLNLKPADGWAEALGCSPTHPVQPWNIIETQSPLELRWRIWVPGSWEAFTKPFLYSPVNKVAPTPTPTPVASPTPTPIATPTPVASPTPTPSAEVKPVVTAKPNPKSTITCSKGKLKKKLVGTKPKCPAGYKIQK